MRWLASAALLLFMAAPLHAQAAHDWRPDERVVITAFDEVGAVARDARRLYAATRGGLVSYDILRGLWELPSTEEDGYPANEQPTALAVDGLQSEVWLGTATGGLYRQRSVPPRWENIAFALGSEVTAIVPSLGAEEEGIWAQTRNGWFRAGRLSFGVTPVPSARVPAAVVQRANAARTLDPGLASFRSTLGLDAQARRWPLTAFVHGERTEEYWFGTAGNFLFRFDALRGQPEWFWYGAASRGVSAIALTGAALWLGSDGRGRRNGVVRASPDLQTWRLFDPLEGGPSGRIDQIEVTDAHIYFAGSDGVSRIDHNGTRVQRVSSDPASTIAIAGEYLWIGTRTGLTLIAGSQSQSMLGAAVYRTRLLGDSVWIAAANGLYHAARDVSPESVQLVRETGLPGTRFVDVARVGNRLYALTEDALFLRDTTGWRGPVRLPSMAGLRRLTVLAADGSALWIGGVNGLARYQPDNEQWLYFLAPGDLPAGPVGIVPAGEHVWLATPAGALRLFWRKP